MCRRPAHVSRARIETGGYRGNQRTGRGLKLPVEVTLRVFVAECTARNVPVVRNPPGGLERELATLDALPDRVGRAGRGAGSRRDHMARVEARESQPWRIAGRLCKDSLSCLGAGVD